MNIEEMLSPEYAIEEAMKGNYGPAANLFMGILAQRKANDDKDFIRTLILETMRCSAMNEANLAMMSHKEFATWVCDRADAVLLELTKRAEPHVSRK